MKKWIYLFLAIIGTILPYTQLIPFLIETNNDMLLLFSSNFESYATSFFSFDLMVTGLTFIAFLLLDSDRKKVRFWWLSLLAIAMVGISLGFPLYLFMRELAREKDEKHK